MKEAGASIFYPEPAEAKKNLEPEPRKNGSAPQHWYRYTVVYSVQCTVIDGHRYFKK